VAGEEIEQNVIIRCDSAGAVSAINTFNGSIQSLTDTNEEMLSSFSKPVEHASLHLFNHEVLTSVGLGGQARTMMSLMSAGLNEVAIAAGTTTAAIAPWLLAIGAVAIAYEKLNAYMKASSEKHDEEKKNFQDETKALADFYEQQVNVSKVGREIAGMNLKLVQDDQREKNQELAEYTSKLDESKNKVIEMGEALHKQTSGMTALAKEYGPQAMEFKKFASEQASSQGELQEKIAKVRAELERLEPEIKKYTDLSHGISDASKKFDEDQAAAAQKSEESFNKMMDKADEMAETYAKEYMAAGQSIDLFLKKQQAQIDLDKGEGNKEDEFKAKLEERTAVTLAAYDRMEAKAKEYGMSIKDLEDKKNEYISAQGHKLATEQAQDLGQVGQIFATTYQSMTSEVGSDFAQMVVAHKSWHDSFVSVIKDVETQFISMVTTLLIKMLTLYAIEEATGMSPQGIGFAQNLTGLKFATGTDSVYDRPTSITVGDGGPERVQVTPLGQQPGGSAGQTSISMSVTVNAGSTTDPNTLANIVGQKVLQQIRGQGQLQFVRTS